MHYVQSVFINPTLLQLHKILFDGTDKSRKVQIIRECYQNAEYGKVKGK